MTGSLTQRINVLIFLQNFPHYSFGEIRWPMGGLYYCGLSLTEGRLITANLTFGVPHSLLYFIEERGGKRERERESERERGEHRRKGRVSFMH